MDLKEQVKKWKRGNGAKGKMTELKRGGTKRDKREKWERGRG